MEKKTLLKKESLITFNKSRNSWTGRLGIPKNFLELADIREDDRNVMISVDSDGVISIKKI